MAEVTVDAVPFILTKPHFEFGPTGDEVTFECAGNAVEVLPEQDENEVETFCGVFTSYKPSKWTATITVVQSFGTDGLEGNMRPLAGAVHPLLIVPDADAVISADNPAITVDARLAPFAFLSGAVGEASEFDLVFTFQGDPEIIETPPA